MNMIKLSRNALFAIALLGGTAFLVGCEEDNDLDTDSDINDATERMEDQADELGNDLEEAGDDAANKMDELGNDIERSVD